MTLEIIDIEKSRWKNRTTKVSVRLSLSSQDTSFASSFSQIFIPELIRIFPELSITGVGPQMSKSISNVRGRPLETFTQAGEEAKLEQEPSQREEELCHISGALIDPCDSSDNTRFSYSLHSKFSNYSPDGSINHQIIPRASENLSVVANRLNLHSMSRWIPLKIERIRFGIESYQKEFLGSMLGMVPGIQSRIYLEVEESSLYLVLEDDKNTNSNVIPLESSETPELLFSSLRRVLDGYDLLQAIRDEMRNEQ